MENKISDMLKVNQEKVHLKDPKKTYHVAGGTKLALITGKTMEQLRDNIKFDKLEDRIERYNQLVEEYKKADKSENTAEEIDEAKKLLAELGVKVKYRQLKNQFFNSPEYKKLSVPRRLIDRVKLLFKSSEIKDQVKQDYYDEFTKHDEAKEKISKDLRNLFSNIKKMSDEEFSELVLNVDKNLDYFDGDIKKDFAEEIKKACTVENPDDKEKIAKRLELINKKFGLDLKIDEPIVEETKKDEEVVKQDIKDETKEKVSQSNPSLNEILKNSKVDEVPKVEPVEKPEIKGESVNTENNNSTIVNLNGDMPEFNTGDPQIDQELHAAYAEELAKIKKAKNPENALPNNTTGERAINDAARKMFNGSVQNQALNNENNSFRTEIKPKEYEEIKFVPQTEIDQQIVRRDYSDYTDYELEKEIERQNETFLRWAFITKGMTEKKFLIDLQEKSEAGLIYRKRKLIESLKINPGTSLTQEDIAILKMNSKDFEKYIKSNEPKEVPKELYLNSRYSTEYFEENKDEFAKANALGEEILKRERIKEEEMLKQKELLEKQRRAEEEREKAILRAKAIARETMINRLILKYGGFFDDPRLVDKLNDNAVEATIKSLKDSNLYDSYKGAAIQNYHRILSEQNTTSEDVKNDHEKVIEDTKEKYGVLPNAERSSDRVVRQLTNKNKK